MRDRSNNRMSIQTLADPACDPPRVDALEVYRRRTEDADTRDRVLRREMLLASAVLVRRARTEANMTQSELADALGVSQARVAQLENATSSNGPPEVMTLARVAHACGRQLTLELV